MIILLIGLLSLATLQADIRIPDNRIPANPLQENKIPSNPLEEDEIPEVPLDRPLPSSVMPPPPVPEDKVEKHEPPLGQDFVIDLDGEEVFQA